MSLRPVLVVAGIGNGSGTGAATARAFAKLGYSVALIARGGDSLTKLAGELNSSGAEALAVPIKDYSPSALTGAFDTITSHFTPSTHALRVALFNAGSLVLKPFLEITPEEVQTSLDSNVVAAFAFSREVLLRFTKNDLPEDGKRGTLIFTGATAALRGNVLTSAFAASKFALRGLNQSLAKEFGKQNIHVAHSIIDGGILTDRSSSYLPAETVQDKDALLSPDAIAQSYVYLVSQHRSSWTWELDLRPSHEKW